jgi:hypothetical protein
MNLPKLALSVRQPWAWAIIFGGKDIENRSQFSLKHMNFDRVERIAIHAAKGMTKEEYASAADFMARGGVACPPAAELRRGGIIGSVSVKGITKQSASRWFIGPRGIRLADPEPCDFIPCAGSLGLFDWGAAATTEAPDPAKWMLAQKVAEGRLL